jgi:hypothetical protein
VVKSAVLESVGLVWWFSLVVDSCGLEAGGQASGGLVWWSRVW